MQYESWDGKSIHSESPQSDSFLSQALHYAFGPQPSNEFDLGRTSAHAAVTGIGVAAVKAAIFGGETSGNVITGIGIGIGTMIIDAGIYGYHKLFDA